MQNTYKKTYEGDYTKSYRDLTAWKQQGQLLKREYQSVSKKLNDKPYDKAERSASYSLGSRPEESGRVSAEGRSAAARNAGMDSRNAQPTTRERRKTMDKAATPPYAPPIAPAKEQPAPENKKWENAYETPVDDGNYKLFDIPIEESGFDRYRNLKTQRDIDANEAREVLKMAGYLPKAGANFGTILFTFILANILAPMIVPIVAVGYGIMKLRSSRTTWTKRTPEQTYRFALPASEGEMNVNKVLGLICIIVGVIAGFVHYQNFSFYDLHSFFE